MVWLDECILSCTFVTNVLFVCYFSYVLPIFLYSLNHYYGSNQCTTRTILYTHHTTYTYSGIDYSHPTQTVSPSTASKTHSSATAAQPSSSSKNNPPPTVSSVPSPPPNGKKPKTFTGTPIASYSASNHPSPSTVHGDEGRITTCTAIRKVGAGGMINSRTGLGLGGVLINHGCLFRKRWMGVWRRRGI